MSSFANPLSSAEVLFGISPLLYDVYDRSWVTKMCPTDIGYGLFVVVLVICAAGYWSSMNTIGSLFQKYVYSSFSMKMVVNCVHIWSVDLFLIKD